MSNNPRRTLDKSEDSSPKQRDAIPALNKSTSSLAMNKTKVSPQKHNPRTTVFEKSAPKPSSDVSPEPSPKIQSNIPSDSLRKPSFTSPPSMSVPRLTSRKSEDSSPVPRNIIPALNKSTSSFAISGTKVSPRNSDPKTSSLEKSVQVLNENISMKDNQIQFLQQRLRQVEETSIDTAQTRDQIEINLQKLQKELHAVKEENRRLKAVTETFTENQYIQESTEDQYNTPSDGQRPSKMQVSLPTLRQELIQTQIQLHKLQEDYDTLVVQKEIMDQELTQNVRDYKVFREQTSKEQNRLMQDMKQTEMDLIQALGEKTALQNKLDQRIEQISEKENIQVVHYKEVVHLQTEISILQRRLVEMEKDLMDKDVVIGDLNSEKDNMEELIELLEETVEELRIDVETADVELDELRMELEELNASTKPAPIKDIAGSSNIDLNNSSDAENDPRSVSSDYDTRQALAVQNARLRDALTQLREQSVREKMEFQRQIRTAEKEADAMISQHDEYCKLKGDHQRLRDELEALKEMVDQSSNFEHMVEKLTDRIISLEEEKLNLESLVNDLEESVEINNALEEALSDEMKVMTKDLQFRDILIANLEEGIKMMKRREQEYQRTMGNYRASMEKLQQEKNALLDLQKDGDGVKIHYLAASQKALSYAARLVNEVNKLRKRNAEALNEKIASQVNAYLSERLEVILSMAVTAPEITSIKGEMLIVSTALKVSLGLSIIGDLCNSDLSKGRDYVKTLSLKAKADCDIPAKSITVTESQLNTIQVAINHTKFMKLLIKSSSHIHRILVAGQWPGLLSVEASMDLASSIIPIISPLDSLISDHLKIFMEDGNLSIHRSNLSQLEKYVDSISSSSAMALNDSGLHVIPHHWNLLCLDLYREISFAKFLCLCSSSILNALLLTDSDYLDEASEEYDMATSFFTKTMGQLDSICSEAIVMNQTLAALDVSYEAVINELFPLVRDWRVTCLDMSESFESTFVRRDVDLADLVKVESSIHTVHKSITKVSSYVRSLNLPVESGVIIHHLSPENKDPWRSITTEIGKLFENDKLNHVKRAQTLKKQLHAFVENESKLSMAETKILQYEKSLATKSKEISMQDVRIGELEGLLSQMSIDANVREAHLTTPAEELLKLADENRMLSEAVRYLQEQVDEYENDAMSHKGGRGHIQNQQKKSVSMEFPKNIDLSFDTGTAVRDFYVDSSASRISLEAALFRPALFAMSCSSSANSVRALEDMMLKLPPLEDKVIRPREELEVLVSCSMDLTLASNQMRILKSSIQLVRCLPDQSKSSHGVKRTRQFIDDEKGKVSKAMSRLEQSSSSAHHIIGLFQAATDNFDSRLKQLPRNTNSQRSQIIGKVTIGGNSPRSVIPLSVRKNDLRNLHAEILCMQR